MNMSKIRLNMAIVGFIKRITSNQLIAFGTLALVVVGVIGLCRPDPPPLNPVTFPVPSVPAPEQPLPGSLPASEPKPTSPAAVSPPVPVSTSELPPPPAGAAPEPKPAPPPPPQKVPLSPSVSEQISMANSVTKGKTYELFTVCPPYEYQEAGAIPEGKSFKMSGKVYSNGFVSKSGIFNGYALVNLEGKYSSLSFDVGHIDGTDTYNKGTTLKIFLDGKFKHEYYIPENRSAQRITVQQNYAKDLQIQTVGGGGVYGFSNLVLTD